MHEIEWLDQLGYGVDGIIWKVKIEGSTYSIKIVCVQIGILFEHIMNFVADLLFVLG